VGEENYMIRMVGAEDWAKGEEPAPIGEVLTPVMESTPVKNANIGGGDYSAHHLKLKPVIAPKKKWVEPERTEHQQRRGVRI